MKKPLKVIPPEMPNFVRLEQDVIVQSGIEHVFTEGIDIINFTEKEALEFADLMKNTFLAHYRDRLINGKPELN